jgi:hypothetical protein
VSDERAPEAARGDGRWWPSPFGADDELGMLNHITDAKRAEAMRLVSTGRMYDLGRVLDENAPVFPGRHFRQTLVTTAHHSDPDIGVGDNKVNWVTEILSGTTQVGTHLDIKEFDDGIAEARFNDLSHWGYGTGWGIVRGLLAALGLSPRAATVAHGAAVYGAAQVTLPALDIAPPAVFWPKREIAIDAFHHTVYAAATGLAYRLIARG